MERYRFSCAFNGLLPSALTHARAEICTPEQSHYERENTHAKAALPTICAIMVGQRTDDLVVSI